MRGADGFFVTSNSRNEKSSINNVEKNLNREHYVIIVEPGNRTKNNPVCEK